jgi:hypothetical protein
MKSDQQTDQQTDQQADQQALMRKPSDEGLPL